MLKCIAIIKGEKASWFSRSPSSAERVSAIKQLAEGNYWYYDNIILEAARSPDSQVREAAAGVVASRVGRVVRARTMEDEFSRFDIRTGDPVFWLKNLPAEDARALVGMASVNRSGYVRQAALERMAERPHAAYVPFVLRRLGDWVPEVREQAHATLEHYKHVQFRQGFFQALPELEGLRAIERVDLKRVYEEIMTWIVGGTDPAVLLEEIRSTADLPRFRIVQYMLAHRLCDEPVLRLLLSDRGFLVRLSAVRHLVGRTEDWVVPLLYGAAVAQCPPVRAVAIRELIARGEASEALLYTTLTDTALSIRDLARSALGLGGDALVAFYRSQLARDRHLVGSILGLADLGQPSDAVSVHQFTGSRDRHVRLAALFALKKLAPSVARQEAESLIVDNYKRIRVLAERILLEHHDRGVLQLGRQLMAANVVMHRMAGLSLLSKFGGWGSLADILNACLDGSARMVDQAWSDLEAWVAYARRLFSAPMAIDIERARNALARVREETPELTYAQKSTLDKVSVFLVG